MKTTISVLALGALALAACGQQQAADDGTYDVSMPLSELMGHVVDPGAWAYWDRSGEYMDANGDWISRVPADPDSIPDDPDTIDDDVERLRLENEWHAAISGAAQVAEGGNLLLLPGRVRTVDNDNIGENWTALAQRLTETAHRAMEAAEDKDGEAMFDIGGELYTVCTACHDKYLVPFLDPETGELPKGLDAEGNPIS